MCSGSSASLERPREDVPARAAAPREPLNMKVVYEHE